MKTLLLVLSLLSTPAFSEEVRLRTYTHVMRGPLTPMGCLSATVTEGNPGDVLGDDPITLSLDENLEATYEETREAKAGKVTFQVKVRRDPKIDFNLSLEARILLNGQGVEKVSFFFNRKNEMTFPYTRLSHVLGVFDPYCEIAEFVLTPEKY